MRAINEYDARITREQEDLKRVLKGIKDFRLSYENGHISVQVDEESTFEMIESYLRKKFALEGGTTAAVCWHSFDNSEMTSDRFDGELRLPGRSIFVKFLNDNAKADEEAKFYLERATQLNPSEIWLFAVNTENIEIDFDPIFTENSIVRGGFRAVGISDVFREFVGSQYNVSAEKDKSHPGAFVFFVTRRSN